MLGCLKQSNSDELLVFSIYFAIMTLKESHTVILHEHTVAQWHGGWGEGGGGARPARFLRGHRKADGVPKSARIKFKIELKS